MGLENARQPTERREKKKSSKLKSRQTLSKHETRREKQNTGFPFRCEQQQIKPKENNKKKTRKTKRNSDRETLPLL